MRSAFPFPAGARRWHGVRGTAMAALTSPSTDGGAAGGDDADPTMAKMSPLRISFSTLLSAFILLHCVTFYSLERGLFDAGFALFSSSAEDKGESQSEGASGGPLVFYSMWTTGPERFGPLHRKCLESVLFHHPNSSFRMFSSTLPRNFFDRYADLGYDISVQRMNYEAYFRGSKLQSLLPKVRSSEFAYSHLTDLFRFHTLWKNGGVYLDTDVFLLKNLDPLCKAIPFAGVIGIQEMGSLDNAYNGAIMCFSHPRHPFLESVIERALKQYDPEDWTSLGPRVLSRAVRWYEKALHVKTFPGPNISVAQHLSAFKNQFLRMQSTVSPNRFERAASHGFLVVLDRVEYFYPRHWSKSLLDVLDSEERKWTNPLDYDPLVEEKEWFNLTHLSYANHIATHFWPAKVKNGPVPKTSFLGKLFQLIPKKHYSSKKRKSHSLQNRKETKEGVRKGRKKED